MGLKEILDEINRDAEVQTDSIINQAKVQTTKMLMNKNEEMEKIYSRKRDVLEKEMDRLEKKLHAKAELEAQRLIYKIENEIVEEILEDSFKAIIQTLKQNENKYSDFLVNHIKTTIEYLEEDELVIALNADDKKLFDKIAKKVKGKISLGDDAPIKGGVLCYAGDNFIDYSIETIFDRYRPQFIKWIMDELTEKKES